MRKFLWRFMGALTLRPSTYEEVEADPRSFPQALLIVVLSELAAGVPYLEGMEVRGAIAELIAVLAFWLLLELAGVSHWRQMAAAEKHASGLGTVASHDGIRRLARDLKNCRRPA